MWGTAQRQRSGIRSSAISYIFFQSHLIFMLRSEQICRGIRTIIFDLSISHFLFYLCILISILSKETGNFWSYFKTLLSRFQKYEISAALNSNIQQAFQISKIFMEYQGRYKENFKFTI